MTDHATLSPSSRSRWKRCPGSVRETIGLPDQPSGPSAVDGTHSHTLLEHCIKADLADPLNMVGVKMKDHDGEFVVDRARAERVKIAVDYIRGRIKDEQIANGWGTTVLLETRVNPEYLLGRKDLSGTVDVQLTLRYSVELIDYKDGFNPVSAENNDQLEQYAFGVLAGYKLPVNGDYPIKFITMTIIQPKLALRGLNPISSHTVTVQEMLGKISQIVVEAAATDNPDAPLVPGEVQCKYCRARGSCSALATNVMKDIGVMFQPMVQSAPVDEISHQTASKDPNTMTDQQIREIMEGAPLMRQLLDSVEEEALKRFKAGISIPGLKAVNGRGSRNWNLSDEQIAEKLKRMGVPKDHIWETKLVSVAKAEKLTWEKTKAGEKVRVQLTERQRKTLDAEYVTKLAGKLTIVPESDSRPAVIMNAAPMFAAVESVPVVDSLPAWLS